MAQTVTPELIEEARRLRKEGHAWHAISRTLGISYYVLRCELDAGFYEYRQRLKVGPPREKPAGRVRADTENRVLAFDRIPDEVLAERDRRKAALAGRTLTQEFFGDPPCGYSALDRRAKG